MSGPAPEKDRHESDEKASQPGSDPGVPQSAKVMEVLNADYALALSTGPQLSPTSRRSLQLYAILLVAFMGSLSNGFDGSVMSAVNGMEQYLTYFNISGLDAGGGVGTVTAIIFGIYSIGSIVGVLIAGPVADRFGRRGGMESIFDAIMVLIIIVGAVVITVAKNVHYLLAGRFVLGFGVAITTTAAPSYVVEMSPPQWRGRLTGLYNTFYYSGSILCTGITIATGRLDSTVSWRAPLAIQIAPAGILFIFVYFIPESPRWLMSVGRNDESRQILAKYHGNDDVNAPLVQLEWKEFEEAIKLDASDKRWWDYSELFNTRNARYRTFMMLLMGFFGQWSGNGLGYFLTILFQNAGVTSQDHRLVLNFANTIISAGGALIGTSLTDKVGRRTMWFWGTLASAGMLAIVTGCTAKFGNTGANPTGANTAIAFIFLFGFVYSLTYTPLQALYPAECLEYNTRAKGMAVYAFAVSCASFVNTYAGPIALGRITWRYYIVYVVWDLFECAVIYFFAVETKGRTLEELNEIFEDRNPVKASIAKHKIAVVEKAGKTVIVKDEVA
ncbi:putative major facilitator superfamily sugar transporter (TC 2.A.1.1) family protein [Lyophyllum shimeji]|uniref:Major facilitator superfamily sugar transporter (TC 2.A.1.1) family protein n=1 Tax=Lyophyllum shimeji TaxID=47721 RepID=A0A9P3UI86_LYOSH|nr:putative major facilitator superfamily sugar transporter (TC 2.A.1.1) family protein [Lyophyllum shimeji]